MVLALVAAGCGGGDSEETTTTTSSTTTSSTTTTTTAPAPPASTTTTEPAINPICLVSQLNAQLDELSPGAGQRYASITFTNSGTKPCQMLGFPGLALVGAPSDDVRSNKPKVLITVPVGGQAYTIIHWTVVPSGNEPDDGPCQPTANQIKITPPNETNSLVQPWTFGPVCGGGDIDVDPMTLGQPPQD